MTFHSVGNVIITDQIIFFRGVGLNQQPVRNRISAHFLGVTLHVDSHRSRQLQALLQFCGTDIFTDKAGGQVRCCSTKDLGYWLNDGLNGLYWVCNGL